MSIQIKEWKEVRPEEKDAVCLASGFRMKWDAGSLWVLEEQGQILLTLQKKDKLGNTFT